MTLVPDEAMSRFVLLGFFPLLCLFNHSFFLPKVTLYHVVRIAYGFFVRMSCWDSQHVLTPHTRQRPILFWHWQKSIHVFYCIVFAKQIYFKYAYSIVTTFVFYYDRLLHGRDLASIHLSPSLAFTPQLIHLLIRLFCSIHISHFSYVLMLAIFQAMLDKYCKSTAILCEYPICMSIMWISMQNAWNKHELIWI